MKNDAVRCKKLTLEDQLHFANAIQLLNRTQGKGLFGPDFLNSYIENKDAFVVGSFINNPSNASIAESLVGIGLANIIRNGFEYYAPFDPMIVDELQQKKVGSFSTLSVHESYQGNGIGQKISQMRLEWATSQKCDVILGISWVSGLTHTSDRVFEKMGFKPVKKVEHFYVEGFIKSPFECPGCKNAPCTCSAILYRLDIMQN